MTKYEIAGKVARANIWVEDNQVVKTDGILCWMENWHIDKVKNFCDLRYYMHLTEL